MKPKNKFQHNIVEASKSLPSITREQIKWGYDNAIEYIGLRSPKGRITCSKCGHSWQGESVSENSILECNCPKCQTILSVETTRKRTYGQLYYMTVITAHKGYQVLRTVLMQCSGKIGEEPKFSHTEVMQRWIAPNGEHVTFALLRQTMGNCYVDAWIRHSALELRQETKENKFCLNVFDQIGIGTVYPRQKLIPEIKRTGYKNGFYGQKPLKLFQLILKDSRAETLLKTGYGKLFERLLDSGWKDSIDKYWPSFRICVRNGYKIDDAILWCDYIDMLEYFQKDVRNAKYVCPANLQREHDRYAIKRAKAEAEHLARYPEKEASFRQAKQKFFGLAFSDELVNVRVLESIAEILMEGRMMHHCVGGYHSKADSLILTACINGKKIETVEVSLSELRVIQSKGVCNKPTEYHDRIVALVNNNIPLIKQRLAA